MRRVPEPRANASKSVRSRTTGEAERRYHAALLRLLAMLNEVSEVSLGLAPGFFAPYYAPPKVSLRLAHYPPVPGETEALRYGAHTDYTACHRHASHGIGHRDTRDKR